MNQKNLLLTALVLLASVTCLFAQDEPAKQDIYELSLEELMNIPINSASKKSETLFDAPLSSYTITKAEIEKSGVTTIMEALRLAPGVIVREQSNGNYDIHIRGFDNILRNSEIYTRNNLATLVMIDNRPVFNHNLGGTFWEALPIDLNDVERIEIVRGPSAPLFGPNAVTGVINIITKRVEEGKTNVFATVQGGTQNTFIANSSVGRNFGKISAQASVNFQQRNRFDETYYLPDANDFFTVEELQQVFNAQPNNTITNLKDQYPDPALAMNKWGANGIVQYKESEDINFELAFGTQQSEVQKVFLGNILAGEIPLTFNESKTSYLNVATKVKDFSFRGSFLTGNDNLSFATSPNRYDFSVTEANAEYTLKLGKTGTLVPGASFQSARYGDGDYKNAGLVFLNGEDATITTVSGFIRTDISPVKNLRVLAALRADKFSSHDDVYLAYELASTYKLNENNLIRFALTQSNSGSFIGNNDLNFIAPLPLGQGINLNRVGNENLDLFTVQMFELGYRVKVSKSLQFDLDGFVQKADQFSALLTSERLSPTIPLRQEFLNVPTAATQTGATFAVNFVPNEKIQIKPFLTWQKTETKNLPSSFNTEAVGTQIGQPVTYSNSKHRATPSVYGGYYLQYNPVKNLSLNVTGYYMSAQTQYGDTDQEIDNIMLVNAKIAYQIKSVTVFVNGRNILNNDSRQFWGTDRAGSTWLAGLSFDLNK
ncbi:MAG: TonB-dependent receptor plug domain-containing protein [Cyclobacteriaceae bacterium]|jgi:iron complex outermembrane receptor protein|nr:TonB-dependent receptor plug domain-containing protein [Cyclobacteriaceae bacterium]